LGDQRSKYFVGDVAVITIGWTESETNSKLEQVEIVKVDYKRIRDITGDDILGESPDCAQKEAIPFALSAIYRKIVSAEDYVTIINWKFADSNYQPGNWSKNECPSSKLTR
jgi:hypothetical protein